MRTLVTASLLSAALLLQPTVAYAGDAGSQPAADGLADAVASAVVVQTPSGNGAGVAVDGDRILTAAHVVDDSDVVRLRADGTTFTGEVIATDPRRDLALLSVPDHGFASVALREQPAQVGETVYAAGAPLGDYVQLTAGIVSALTEIRGVDQVQTDAPINPGNSGGPLLDPDGKIVGIVVTKSDGNEGIGWATAASEAADFLAAAGSVPADVGPSNQDSAPASASAASASWLGRVGAGSLAAMTVLLVFLVRRRRPASLAPSAGAVSTPGAPPAPIYVYPPLDLTNDPQLSAAPTIAATRKQPTEPFKEKTWTP